MDQSQKMKFVLALHKHSLQALDSGGILGIPGAFTVQNEYNAAGPDMGQATAGQNQLAGQLQQTAAGQGPNAAQYQFQRNSGQIAQQAANNYSQNRALNPGLAARMSGNTAANIGQQQASQSAELQAQQQVAAQQQLAQIYGQQQQASLGAQGINSQVSQNNANSVNKEQQGILGGIASSVPLLGGLFAHGGMAQKMAGGGGMGSMFSSGNTAGSISTPFAPSFSNASIINQPSEKKDGPQSGAGQLLDGSEAGGATTSNMFAPISESLAGGAGDTAGLEELAPLAIAAFKGGQIPSKMAPNKLMESGGGVKAGSPGQKAKVSGDSLKNDKIPAVLSEGEIVIPRHITMGANAPAKAAEFVQMTLNKRRMGKKL